jgi:mono/diheme cytochrome c family protein
MTTFRRMIPQYFAIMLLWLTSGCEDSMRDYARVKPFDESAFFPDKRSVRSPIPGTIARGKLHDDSVYFTGRNAEGFIKENPVALTRELLLRGRQRYTIYCSVCHGADGSGHGIVVERGFTPPPAYSLDRLRQSPDGYFFEVITHGKGAMYPYASRVTPADRWAIVSYIRVLQLSQHATLSDVPEADKLKLGASVHD